MSTSPLPPIEPILKEARIRNFRCLKEVEIHFSPLTFFVGPNGSGKSAALDAIAHDIYKSPEDHWRYDKDRYTYTMLFTANDIYIASTLSKAHIQNQKNLQSEIISNGDIVFVSYKLLYENNDSPKRKTFQINTLNTRHAATPAQATTLSNDGDNLVNLIATMSRKQQSALSEALCQRVPIYSDVDFTPIRDGKLQLRFYDRWDESIVYTPDQVSDGTMFMLAFLAMQFQPEPPDLIMIEEPERGLHPYLMSELVEMLRQLAHGQLGPKPIQVILATHSAQLIEYAQPEELRFFSRRAEDGATVVHQIDPSDPHWQKGFELYERSLSEAWLSGALGGVPRKLPPQNGGASK